MLLHTSKKKNAFGHLHLRWTEINKQTHLFQSQQWKYITTTKQFYTLVISVLFTLETTEYTNNKSFTGTAANLNIVLWKYNLKMKAPTAHSRFWPWSYCCLEKNSLLFWTSGLMVSLPGFQPAGHTEKKSLRWVWQLRHVAIWVQTRKSIFTMWSVFALNHTCIYFPLSLVAKFMWILTLIRTSAFEVE